MYQSEATFRILQKILKLKAQEAASYEPELMSTPESALENFLLAYIKKQTSQKQPEIYHKLSNYVLQQRFCKLIPDWFNNLEEVHIMACSTFKAYHFDPDCKAFCLYGKAISGIKRKIKQTQNERKEITNQLENAIFQLHNQHLLPLSKGQSHQIEDILLHFDTPDSHFDPILLSNEVYSPFIPNTYALVMVLPVNHHRHDHLIHFVRSSLLHVFSEQINLLQRIMTRQIFYKNSIVRGIYFIEEGEVESTSGRIIARGWVTNGKCKSEGIGWKFKALPFFKSIAKSDHLWKQFLNDVSLNKEYPLKMSYILGLDEEHESFEKYERRGGKKGYLRLPRIGNKSFDYSKLVELQKVKHYDDKIGDLCNFKEKMLLKKIGKSTNKAFAQLGSSHNQHEYHKKMLKNQSSSKTMLSKSLSSSSQNILIMSVLKKLESLTEPKTGQREEPKERRDKIRISPVQLYEKSRIMKKKRYNQ